MTPAVVAGYAVKRDDQILNHTFALTARQAMCNWLSIYEMLLMGLKPQDDEVMNCFCMCQRQYPDGEIELIEVRMTETRMVDPRAMTSEKLNAKLA